MRISLANSIVPFNFSTIDEAPSVCAIMSLVPCNHTSVLITFLFALTFFFFSPSFSFILHFSSSYWVGRCRCLFGDYVITTTPTLLFFHRFAASGTLLRRFLRYVFEKKSSLFLSYVCFVGWLVGWLDDWLTG